MKQVKQDPNKLQEKRLLSTKDNQVSKAVKFGKFKDIIATPSFVEKPIRNLVKNKKDSTKKPVFVKHEVDFEPELKLSKEQIEFIFEGDLLDVGDYQDVIEQLLSEINVLDENLTALDRIKKALSFRRARVKIKRGRQLAMRRRANSATIGKRSRRSAIELIKRRFAGGRNIQDLSVSEKNRVERMVKKRKGAVSRLARRLMVSKRKYESDRISHKASGN